mgnify:CR=1 FL=1
METIININSNLINKLIKLINPKELFYKFDTSLKTIYGINTFNLNLILWQMFQMV